MEGTGQGPSHGRPAGKGRPPRLRLNGQPAATYTWHVAPGGVLVVVDLDATGWRLVTNDAAGVVFDLTELQPDLLPRLPMVPTETAWGSGTPSAPTSRAGSQASSHGRPERD